MLVIGAVEHPFNYHFERNDQLEYWTMGYLQHGRISTRTALGTCIRATGSISLIPPHTSYAMEWAGRHEQRWNEMYAVFAPPASWSHLLSWPLQRHGLGVLEIEDAELRDEVENTLHSAMRLLRSARSSRLPLAFNAMERVLLLLDEINPLRGYEQLDGRVRQSLEYISRHFQEEISLEILAREACLSPSRFSHLFRVQMKLSPIQYVERYRLERAAEKLLSTNQSIEQIAHENGFVNSFHFSTRFRRYFKQAPSRYRLNPKL